METDNSTLLQSVVLPSATEGPPEKPVRANSTHTKQQERQRTLSVGYSLNSNANFYDIPVVSNYFKHQHYNGINSVSPLERHFL